MRWALCTGRSRMPSAADPDYVILDVENRVRKPVLCHPSILIERLFEAHLLKAVGLDPAMEPN
jgi:hypothetical protein